MKMQNRNVVPFLDNATSHQETIKKNLWNMKLFNEISENCSIDEYVEVDNTLATSEEVDISKIDWRKKLRYECIQEVMNVETANSDLEDEDESQESSSSSVLVNVYYDTTFRELSFLLLNIAYIPYSFLLKMPT